MQNINGKTALGLDTNIGALLCYVGNFICSFGLIYSIIVVITDKTNKLTRFHAFQSILCSVLGIIVGGVAGLGGMIAELVDSQIGFPLLSLVIGLVAVIVGFGLMIMYFLAAFKGFKGEIYKIPVIGGLADKWSDTV